MKSLKFKDKNYRNIYKKKELFQLWYKIIFFDPNLNCLKKRNIVKFLFFEFKKITLVKIKNRCNFTNRGLGIYSFFGLSRIALRKYSSLGLLNGIQKASW